jgi:hypothetical protein
MPPAVSHRRSVDTQRRACYNSHVCTHVDLPNPDLDHFFAEGTPVSVLLPAEIPALLG